MRLVIVNADDFGYSSGVNRGVVEAHEHGIVTSASLMVHRPAAADAAEYSREHRELAVGLHVELEHRRIRERLWPAERLLRLAASDVAEQLERFRALMGCEPTHLDSHFHRHRRAPFRSLFESLARERGVPIRHLDPGVHFCGEFYGHDGRGQPEPEAITPDALVAILETLPEGITELGCHPGYADGLDSWYREERETEVASLCDPLVREAIERLDIELVSFRDLGDRRAGGPS